MRTSNEKYIFFVNIIGEKIFGMKFWVFVFWNFEISDESGNRIF